MRRLLALCLFAAALPAAAADAPARTDYKVLPSGRYAVKVSGMLTVTCGRAIEREVAKLPEVESAKVDFDSEQLTVVVRLEKSLKVSALRRALHRAAKKMDLGADYTAGAASYLP